jgi:hypothetical protein
LDASFIQSGPFQFCLTNRIEQHLTLDNDNHIFLYKHRKHDRTTDRDVDFTDHPFSLDLYAQHAFRTFNPFLYRSLLARLLHVNALEEEMCLTLSLLFWRKEGSRRIARKIFADISRRRNVQLRLSWYTKEMSTSERLNILESMGMGLRSSLFFGGDFPVKGAVHLSRFQHFRTQLGYLHEQMRVWKPRTVRELFIPGYYDRFAWFVAIFGITFGVIASLGLIANIVQIAIAVIMLRLALRQEDAAAAR